MNKTNESAVLIVLHWSVIGIDACCDETGWKMILVTKSHGMSVATKKISPSAETIPVDRFGSQLVSQRKVESEHSRSL